MKNLLFCFLILLFTAGCTKEPQDLSANYPDVIFRYEFENLEGFGFDDDLISFYQGVSKSFSDGGKLCYKGNGYVYKTGSEASRFFGALYEQVEEVKFSVSGLESSEYDYIAALRNNKIWVGQFDKSTKKQVAEWYGNCLITDGKIKYQLGWEERSFDASDIGILEVTDTYIHLIVSEAQVILMFETSVCHNYGFVMSVFDWHERSYMLMTNEDLLLFGKAGNWMGRYEKKAFFHKNCIPISYTEYIEFRGDGVRRHTLDQENAIWHWVPGEESIFHTFMESHKVIDRSADVWKMKAIDKESNEYFFSVNINTGEVIYPI